MRSVSFCFASVVVITTLFSTSPKSAEPKPATPVFTLEAKTKTANFTAKKPVARATINPSRLLSPVLHVTPGAPGAPRVALTLDACTGKVDQRILEALITNNIKATIFVTARWMKRNPEAMLQLLSRSDLFAIENHGAAHLAAMDRPGNIFGVRAAGSADAIGEEIRAGAASIKKATGREPHWYRGATARYTATALPIIAAEGEKLAGYSLSGDGGAAFSQRKAAITIASAQDGDVIIAHINQPDRPAGAGVVEGLLALKAKGYVFVGLNTPTIGH